MKPQPSRFPIALALALAVSAAPALARDHDHKGGIRSQPTKVVVPFDDIGVLTTAGFDGVTAALRVNASMHNPLLCVANVFKVGSGNLSLPGKVNQ